MPLNPRSIHDIPWLFYIPSALQGEKKKGKKRKKHGHEAAQPDDGIITLTS